MPYNAELKITTKFNGHQTVPVELFYSAPYKLTNYFPTVHNGIEYIVMNASAGVMAGDHYNVNITVGENSHLSLISQSFEKIHKMDAGEAVRKISINVEKNAYLKYIPLPTIPFANSAFRSTTKIYLENATSKLIFADILSSGRHVCDEQFSYRYYHNCIDIFLDNKLLFRDNAIFNPSDHLLNAYGMFENYNYLTNLIIYGFTLSETTIEKIISIFDSIEIEAGITELLGGGYLIRTLGNSSEIIINTFKEIVELCDEQKKEQ